MSHSEITGGVCGSDAARSGALTVRQVSYEIAFDGVILRSDLLGYPRENAVASDWSIGACEEACRAVLVLGLGEA